MPDSLVTRISQDRWRIAAWIIPAVIFVLVANKVILPMANQYRNVSNRLETFRENTYEPEWLDSTRAALQHDVALLQAFKASREASLNKDSSVQGTIDRIRSLAQKSGLEVVKTTPILAKNDSLSLLKVRIEGYSHYPGFLDFLAEIKSNHPDLFPKEMLLRQGGERTKGRLDVHVVLHVFDRRTPGAQP